MPWWEDERIPVSFCSEKMKRDHQLRIKEKRKYRRVKRKVIKSIF